MCGLYLGLVMGRQSGQTQPAHRHGVRGETVVQNYHDTKDTDELQWSNGAWGWMMSRTSLCSQGESLDGEPLEKIIL